MRFFFCLFFFCNAVLFLVFVYSHFTEDYGKSCLDTAVKLLEKLCNGVKPSSFTQNFPEVPVACMNVVASVSDFVYHSNQQVWEVNVRMSDVCISDRMKSCLSQKLCWSYLGHSRGWKSEAVCKKHDLPGLKHHEKMAQSVLPTELVILVANKNRGDWSEQLCYVFK